MAFKMKNMAYWKAKNSSTFTKPDDDKTTKTPESGSIKFPDDDSEFWDTPVTIAGGKEVSKAEYIAWMKANPHRWKGPRHP